MSIECTACRHLNSSEDSRCERCGRRLHVAKVRPAPSGYAPEGALALQAKLEPKPAVLTLPKERAKAAAAAAPQAPLFSSAPDAPRVVPIFGPVQQSRRPAPPSRQRVSSAGRRKEQQQLEFSQPLPSSGPVESEIYCDAPVAATPHRILAGFVDAGIVCGGWISILAIYLLAGHGKLVADAWTLGAGAFLAASVMLTYQVFWVLANGDSPGLRTAKLRLIDFDGRRPTREQRLARVAAVWLSVASLGLGLLWALMDEESLTWHDHISKTFPTPERDSDI